jgi:N-acetylglucosamine malate deacetylase 1
MSVLYIFAHFDDEYAALPLLTERARAGLEQRLIYIADYASPALAERRFLETRRLLERIGVPGEAARHAGRGAGARDGALHRALPAAEAAVREAAAGLEIERLVVPAWEGGHPDHDSLAFLAVRLSQALGAVPIDQVSLYNGRGLPGRLFRGASPLPENGPVTRVPISAADWARYAGAVRCFPSQWRTWAGLWPAMFATFVRSGYRYQQLSPERVRERPHAGPLLYERMYGTPYTEVRAALDALG